MDGITGVQQRIAQIQSMFAPLAPPAVRAPVQSQPTGQAFADVLAKVSAPTATTTRAVPSAAVTAAAKAGHKHVSPPPELARYGNGRIPAGALSEIGRGAHRLWAPAAASFRQLAAAAARDGVRIGVTDSYRSYEQQVDLARRKGLYSQGGLAATPGRSNHGWGLSLDLDLDNRAQAWMRANGARFGFVEDVPREPWHWTYHGGR
jgi:D-alanyl-D-alanine carboxypeptidase